MNKPQTPFDQAVAKAAEEFRQELENARAEVAAQIEAERKPWWRK